MQVLRARGLPDPHPARSRSRPAVPLHLRALALARRARLDPETGDERFARVKVPEVLARFVGVGERLVPLEAVIAHFLPRLFPGMEIAERAPFRVTRDADFEVSDDADDLLEAVEPELRRRRFGDVVRLEVAASASRAMRERLDRRPRRPARAGLCDRGPARPGRPPPARATRPPRPEARGVGPGRPAALGARAAPARCSRRSAAATSSSSSPYDSFRASFEAFVQAAARDPDVIAIKTTVYRTSDESSLVSR